MQHLPSADRSLQFSTFPGQMGRLVGRVYSAYKPTVEWIFWKVWKIPGADSFEGLTARANLRRLPPREESRSLKARAKRGMKFLLRVGGEKISNRVRARLSSNNYDLYHEPGLFPLPSDLPTIVTLHDHSLLLFPQWHRKEEIARFETSIASILQNSVHLVSTSEFVRQQAIKLLNVPASKITCVRPGINPEAQPLSENAVRSDLSKAGFPAEYLLYVGPLEDRHNLLMLLQAYVTLPETLRTRFPLVLVGRWGWQSQHIANYFHAEAKHRGVIQRDPLPDNIMPSVYNGARCLVDPSFYEGFSPAPLEMLACGGNVLAADIPAFRESLPEKIRFIDPWDREGWRKCLHEALTNRDYFDLTHSGSSHLSWSWSQTASQMVALYRRILQPGEVETTESLPLRRSA
jgi:alpha-1,3-rhamnosyl/mannosyltransferase